jgi:hypothetical protein
MSKFSFGGWGSNGDENLGKVKDRPFGGVGGGGGGMREPSLMDLRRLLLRQLPATSA